MPRFLPAALCGRGGVGGLLERSVSALALTGAARGIWGTDLTAITQARSLRSAGEVLAFRRGAAATGDHLACLLPRPAALLGTWVSTR